MAGRIPLGYCALLALTIVFPALAEDTPSFTDTHAAGLHGYAVWCAPCHGIDGRGDGHWARNLHGRPPRDLTQGLYEHRGTVDRARREDLARTILEGVPGTEMPAFRGLVDGRAALAIAEAVLAMSSRNSEEPPGDPVEIPAETPDNEESRARGRTLFLDGCAGCHGTGGRGDGKKSAELKDTRGRAVRPRDLVYEPLECGEDAVAIYTVLAAGMEGVPMPPQDLFLESEEIWDLVHYVRSLRRERTPMWKFLRGDPLDPTTRR